MKQLLAMSRKTSLVATLALLAALAPRAGLAQNGRTVTDPVAKEECSACHMAYQPAFLPAESWKKIFADLSNHFGEDASLDPKTEARIRSYYIQNAARWNAIPKPVPIRITELPWFTREHGRFARRAKQDPKIGSLSNCTACHRNAERGWFDDD